MRAVARAAAHLAAANAERERVLKQFDELAGELTSRALTSSRSASAAREDVLAQFEALAERFEASARFQPGETDCRTRGQCAAELRGVVAKLRE